jgi:hypothetical protein
MVTFGIPVADFAAAAAVSKKLSSITDREPAPSAVSVSPGVPASNAPRSVAIALMPITEYRLLQTYLLIEPAAHEAQ